MDGNKTDRPSSIVTEQAARWHARLQAADCTPGERLAFERWRSERPEHAHAGELAEKITADFDRLLASDARLQALARQACADRTYISGGSAASAGHKVTRRWAIPAAFAASLALGVMALYAVRFAPPEVDAVAYDTASERRTLTLADGSIVQMDVATHLQVSMSAARRQVTLLSGRALFQVSHDASRPFSVTAAGARTTALGTRFQVQSEREHVLVTLAEGSVAVDDVRGTPGTAAAGWSERLRPGEELSFDVRSSAVAKHMVDLQHATGWSRGRHVFRGTPLAEAIEEINRYATRKVRLGDPSLAALPVGGNFLSGDSELIVEGLAAVLPVRAVVGGSDEILLFRRYE